MNSMPADCDRRCLGAILQRRRLLCAEGLRRDITPKLFAKSLVGVSNSLLRLAHYFKNATSSCYALLRSPKPEGRIAVLNNVWSLHAKQSGYHHVSKGLGMVIPSEYTRLVPATVIGDRLDRAYQVALAMKLTGRDQLLVVDGDSHLELIEGLRKVTNARIYAVFHQIPRVLAECLAQTPGQVLDGAVCVARCQIPLVQSLAPPGKSWFVPHGINVDYYTPGGTCSNQPSVLCVGSNCRDFDTLSRSGDLIAAAVPAVSIQLVAAPSELPPGLDLGRVELINGLSDEQLLEEYRRAWVVLLPLTDSTANNALLESLACGKPIVTTDIGGVRDYVGPECGALCPPGDAHAHASETIGLLRDSFRREAGGQAARERAKTYSWPVVREQLRLILAN